MRLAETREGGNVVLGGRSTQNPILDSFFFGQNQFLIVKIPILTTTNYLRDQTQSFFYPQTYLPYVCFYL